MTRSILRTRKNHNMGKHGAEKENIFPSIVSLTPLSMASSMISCCVLEISLIVIHKTIPVEG